MTTLPWGRPSNRQAGKREVVPYTSSLYLSSILKRLAPTNPLAPSTRIGPWSFRILASADDCAPSTGGEVKGVMLPCAFSLVFAMSPSGRGDAWGPSNTGEPVSSYSALVALSGPGVSLILVRFLNIALSSALSLLSLMQGLRFQVRACPQHLVNCNLFPWTVAR